MFARNHLLFLYYAIKMKKKYDISLMGYINLFESLSKVKVKDAYVKDNTIVFIVEEGGLGRALGKNGSNVKKLVELIKKKIKLIEFNSKVERFIKNFIYPIKAESIILEDEVVKIRVMGAKTKGLLIGRESKNLKELRAVVSRFFKIKDIKIE